MTRPRIDDPGLMGILAEITADKLREVGGLAGLKTGAVLEAIQVGDGDGYHMARRLEDLGWEVRFVAAEILQGSVEEHQHLYRMALNGWAILSRITLDRAVGDRVRFNFSGRIVEAPITEVCSDYFQYKVEIPGEGIFVYVDCENVLT